MKRLKPHAKATAVLFRRGSPPDRQVAPAARADFTFRRPVTTNTRDALSEAGLRPRTLRVMHTLGRALHPSAQVSPAAGQLLSAADEPPHLVRR